MRILPITNYPVQNLYTSKNSSVKFNQTPNDSFIFRGSNIKGAVPTTESLKKEIPYLGEVLNGDFECSIKEVHPDKNGKLADNDAWDVIDEMEEKSPRFPNRKEINALWNVLQEDLKNPDEAQKQGREVQENKKGYCFKFKKSDSNNQVDFHFSKGGMLTKVVVNDRLSDSDMDSEYDGTICYKIGWQPYDLNMNVNIPSAHNSTAGTKYNIYKEGYDDGDLFGWTGKNKSREIASAYAYKRGSFESYSVS